jgi:hypothetical protein
MDRTWFPASHERNSFLHYDAGSSSRERVSSPRNKTGATAIECGVVATIILVVAASIVW